ncbi:MAG: helix-turn-helix domain-containing protein [Wolinella sp.]
MKESEKILARMRLLAGVKTDKELAELFDINYRTLDNWRTRGGIPKKRIEAISKRLGVPPSLLTKDGIANSINIMTTINGSRNSYNNNIAINGTERPASSQSHDEELLARFCELYRNYRTPKMEQSLLELIEKLEAVRQATE